DTAAYYTGRNFGKRKIAPMVSPGKTVEGALGQVFCASVFAVTCGKYFGMEQSLLELLLVGIILSTTAIYSDISESLIKRVFNVKDSGTIIPGHGGFLDRVDSFFFTAPLFYFYLLVT
ncbi:MAG: phosphatidate cytidylyltransferase, partial [Nitrospinae bacterium]|nr:phosphatidate cytidylyltransferase [Nitrospinota bacterium]